MTQWASNMVPKSKIYNEETTDVVLYQQALENHDMKRVRNLLTHYNKGQCVTLCGTSAKYMSKDVLTVDCGECLEKLGSGTTKAEPAFIGIQPTYEELLNDLFKREVGGF